MLWQWHSKIGSNSKTSLPVSVTSFLQFMFVLDNFAKRSMSHIYFLLPNWVATKSVTCFLFEVFFSDWRVDINLLNVLVTAGMWLYLIDTSNFEGSECEIMHFVSQIYRHAQRLFCGWTTVQHRIKTGLFIPRWSHSSTSSRKTAFWGRLLLSTLRPGILLCPPILFMLWQRWEKAFKKAKNLYDFSDYETALRSVGITLKMRPDDFLDFKSCLSQSEVSKKTRPLLADVYVAQFRRGSTNMYFKTGHAEGKFREADFLVKRWKDCMKMATFFEKIPVKNSENSAQSRKEDIIRKMGPLMPSDRLDFWRNL